MGRTQRWAAVALGAAAVAASVGGTAQSASAKPGTPYQVCGPRGCPAQLTAGTFELGLAGQIAGKTVDSGPGSTTVVFSLYRRGVVVRTVRHTVTEGVLPYQIPAPSVDWIRIQVCDDTGRCLGQSYPTK